MPTALIDKDLMDLLATVTFTKTTYIRPHEYLLHSWSEACALVFEALAQAIDRDGYDRRFYSKTYRYLNIEGYKYWIVGEVLNRERLPEEEIHGNP